MLSLAELSLIIIDMGGSITSEVGCHFRVLWFSVGMCTDVFMWYNCYWLS